jgi:hypothetical protein
LVWSLPLGHDEECDAEGNKAPTIGPRALAPKAVVLEGYRTRFLPVESSSATGPGWLDDARDALPGSKLPFRMCAEWRHMWIGSPTPNLGNSRRRCQINVLGDGGIPCKAPHWRTCGSPPRSATHPQLGLLLAWAPTANVDVIEMVAGKFQRAEVEGTTLSLRTMRGSFIGTTLGDTMWIESMWNDEPIEMLKMTHKSLPSMPTVGVLIPRQDICRCKGL